MILEFLEAIKEHVGGAMFSIQFEQREYTSHHVTHIARLHFTVSYSGVLHTNWQYQYITCINESEHYKRDINWKNL